LIHSKFGDLLTKGISVDDEAAGRALRTREPDDVRRLVHAWTPAMLRLARLHVSNAAAAEDVVQDSWLVVFSGMDRFAGRSSLRTYVLGVVLNIARRAGHVERRVIPFSATWRDTRNELRGPALPPERFDANGGWAQPPTVWTTQPESLLVTAELRQVLEEALDDLPSRQRAIMTARDVLGLTAAEVGDLYDVSEGNQRVLLHRARAKVRGNVNAYLTGEVTDGAARRIRRSSRTSRIRAGHPIACRQLVELVDDYLDGRLRRDMRQRVEEHLAHCDHCGEYVEQVRRVLDVTSALTPNAPVLLIDRLCAVLRGGSMSSA
jgi:RNA polymerase sigma-70 factor (ECF subfamily)